jgi:hypothetical protein
MRLFQIYIGSFFIGFYTWIVTIYFGAVLLDVVYANSVPESTAAPSESADFLLLIAFVTFLAALGAIIFSWKSSAARIYFIASFIIWIFEFLMPLFFSQLIKGTQGAGTSIRLIMNGMGSILAMIGLYKFFRTGLITHKSD